MDIFFTLINLLIWRLKMKKAASQSVITLVLNGISILALIFMTVSLSSYNDVKNQLDTANEERFELTYNANRFMNGSSYLTNEVRAFATTGDGTHYDNYWNEVDNLKNRDQGIAAMQEIGITDKEQSMINEMSSISNALVPLEEEAMEQAKNGQRDKAVSYVYGKEYSQSVSEINSIKEQFLQILDERTYANVNNLVKKSEAIKKTMNVSLAVVALLQLLNMAVIKYRILKPVTVIRDQMCEISEGNLSADFSLSPDTSEIGMLVASIYETKQELKKYINDIDFKLNEMANGNMDLEAGIGYRGEFLPIQDALGQILDSLNNALFKINITAQKVSKESERMATGAQTLSAGAMKQASAVQELSSSIQEISGQVGHTSEDANNAKKYSMDASARLEKCNNEMAGLSAAMEEISKSSQRIGGIIKTIEDISFQTNILALNASVEAARAGVAGKGFAVVAGEVQSLANKSSASAKNISELINNSMLLVEHGTGLTASTTKALADVVDGARKSTILVESIAESATKQAKSLRQITLGMEQISEVVQTTASTAEDSAASARELYNHSNELKNSIQKFHLRNTYNNGFLIKAKDQAESI